MRRLSILVALLCASFNAWGLSFSPASPSTSGAYTVLWSQPLGCDDTNNPYFDCYDLRESTDGGQSWNTVASAAYQGLTSWNVSGKTVGTYDYAVFYYMGAFPGSYDTPVESGTMVVQSQAVNFTIVNATGTEGGGVVFTVTKNGTTSQTTGVSWATNTNGTATSGSDYSAASGTLSFGPSDVTQTFTVYTLQDSTAEYPETFGVDLGSPTGPGASLGAPWSAGGTINDDDPVPTVSISDASVTENGDLVFTATLSHPAVYSVSVNVAVTDGSTTVNSDYQPYGFSAFGFNPFETSTPFVLHTLPDSVYEGNETLTVTISPISGAILRSATAPASARSSRTIPCRASRSTT